VAETKARILEAATTEYARNGIENTSMQAVARQADVAAGTVLYHYPTPDDLTAAVVAHWLDRIEPPSAAEIDPNAPLETRVRDLVTALFQFYERSNWANQIYKLSPDNRVLVAARVDWDRSFDALITTALGDGYKGAHATRLVSVFVDADFYGLLLSRRFSSAKAIEIAANLILSSATES
jgi:AcrR family transcriptional regulator